MTPYGIGKITIEDNGHGIIPSIFQNSFLKISTNFKEVHKTSLGLNRLSLGSKGLGRLSFQRLGNFVEVFTTPKINIFELKNLLLEGDKEVLRDYNSFKLDIDWSKIDSNLDLTDLGATLYYLNTENKNGTSIVISGLSQLAFWDSNRKTFTELTKNIYSMTNPFIPKENKNKFTVKLYLDEKLIETDVIDENLFNDFSRAVIDFKFKDYEFTLSRVYKESMIRSFIDNKVKKQELLGFVLDKYPDNLCQFFEKSISFNLEELLKDNRDFKYLKLDFSSDKDGNFAYFGNFSGKLYHAQMKDDQIMSYIDVNANINKIILKNIWNKNSGISVYRNGFRVLPYGNKTDWIGFDRYNSKVKFGPFSYENISGFINLDGISSISLKEQTNRQGFMEDEYGRNFMQFIQNILRELIQRDFTNLRDDFILPKTKKMEDGDYWESLNGLLSFKKRDISSSSEEVIKMLNETKEIVDDIVSGEKQENTVKDLAQVQKNLGKAVRKSSEAFKEIEVSKNQEVALKDEELNQIKDIYPIAAIGIITEGLTHELHRIESNIKDYANKTKTLLNSIHDEVKHEVISYQNRIIDETIFIKEQLSHLEPGMKKNATLFSTINLKDFLDQTYLQAGPMRRKADNNNIKVQIIGETFFIKANPGFLISIFDNLFLNSLYWLEKNNKEKVITFDLSSPGVVHFYDSGPGVSKDMDYKLFEPFQSSKPDGRGLGLFIVTNLIQDLHGTIDLAKEQNEYGNRYKFEIKFEQLAQKLSLF